MDNQMMGEKLKSYYAIKLSILGFINNPHPALA
jgi:hypothetical protein